MRGGGGGLVFKLDNLSQHKLCVSEKNNGNMWRRNTNIKVLIDRTMSKVLLEITILFIYATKKKDPRNFGYSCQGRHDYKFIF